MRIVFRSGSVSQYLEQPILERIWKQVDINYLVKVTCKKTILIICGLTFTFLYLKPCRFYITNKSL